ncbi:MAG: hypothetical protein JW816_00465 [Candidatus Buchananbacteria bacterium]|nr:hypothetical protein [Candidatus Buchananbacteria bacterium]
MFATRVKKAVFWSLILFIFALVVSAVYFGRETVQTTDMVLVSHQAQTLERLMYGDIIAYAEIAPLVGRPEKIRALAVELHWDDAKTSNAIEGISSGKDLMVQCWLRGLMPPAKLVGRDP